MLTLKEANSIAYQQLQKLQASCNLQLAIIEEETLETDKLWVFFYNSEQYLSTLDEKFLLAGNSPIAIEKANGNIHRTGTAFPIEDYVAEIESRLNQ